MDGFCVLFDSKPDGRAWARARKRLGRDPEVLYKRSDSEYDFIVDDTIIIEVDDSLPPGHWALGLQE
jgi:hypothetical protein